MHVLDRQKTVRVHVQMLPAGSEHTVLLVWVRPVKPWGIQKLYFLQRRKKKCPLEGDYIHYCTLCLHVYLYIDVNSSKNRSEETPGIKQPRHRDRLGLYHLVMRSQQAWSQRASNCQDRWRRDEALHSNPWLTYILSISNVSLTGINGAVMDSEKPR